MRFHIACIALVCLACAAPKRPVPGESGHEGISEADWSAIARHNAFDQVLLERLQALAAGEGPARRRWTMLVLSGGGQHGAFGAGILAGWPMGADADPEPDTAPREQLVPLRPVFDLVTGVSTGALQSTSAFLHDADLDEQLARFYSTIEDDDVFSVHRVLRIPLESGAAEYEGLSEILREEVLSDAVIDRVGAEYGRGRTLWVGTCNLDTGGFQPWNLTYLALRARDEPDFYDLYRRVVLASASLPVAVEPQYLNGSMHVDGGTARNVFVPTFLARVAQEVPEHVDLDLFVIMNGKLGVPVAVTDPKLFSVALRVVDVMIQRNSWNSLLAMRGEILVAAARHGLRPDRIQPYIAYVPDDYAEPESGVAFDTPYMKQLVEYGRQFGQRGLWARELPEETLDAWD